MTTVRDAMIVAGGQGTRLRPLTATTPKPLLPLVGLPFLEGMIARLADAGIERVWLVVGADPAPFGPLRAAAASRGVRVEVVPEPTPLDTAGGVRAAVERVAGTFLVLNGDVLHGLDLAALVNHHRVAGAAATLSLIRVADTSTFGVCVRDGDRIVDFVEKPPPGSLPGQDAVNAGTYVLEPDALTRFPVGRLSFERQVFPGLVADGAVVHGVVSDAAWADLGTPERYLAGHRLVLDRAVAWPTVTGSGDRHLGVDVEVAPSATLQGPIWLGDGVMVAADARLGPYTVVGAGSRIAADAVLQGSVLHDRVSVGAGAVLEGTIVGAGSRLGAGVRLASASVIGAEATVAAGVRVPRGGRVPDDAAARS